MRLLLAPLFRWLILSQAKKESGAETSSRRCRDSRSRSRSSDHEPRPQKKKRFKRQKHENDKEANADSVVREHVDDKVPQQETEEEYDARLEREELKRLEEAKRRELERIKRRYESTPPATEGGVRFKGWSSVAVLFMSG